MTKKRKDKKNIKKITENRKVKCVFWGILAFFAIVCLGAAFSENLLRASVGIDGFESQYSEVSSKTRKALRSELENFALLNTGEASRKMPKFAIREDQLFVIDEDEDGKRYSSFYIDSDELQISALVQMNWGRGLSSPDTGFIVRIDCATENNIKYEDSHCYSHSTGEAAGAMQLENLGLLESYGASSKAIGAARDVMLSYLKKAYPGATAALVNRDSIVGDGDISAKLKLDNDKEFDLVIKSGTNWGVELKSGENLIWQKSADEMIAVERHYLALEKLLPIELETETGARFTLSYMNKGQLAINSVKCAESTQNSEFERAAKTWLKDNNFDSEAFEIKLKNSCEN